MNLNKKFIRAYSKVALRIHGMDEVGVRFPIGPQLLAYHARFPNSYAQALFELLASQFVTALADATKIQGETFCGPRLRYPPLRFASQLKTERSPESNGGWESRGRFPIGPRTFWSDHFARIDL